MAYEEVATHHVFQMLFHLEQARSQLNEASQGHAYIMNFRLGKASAEIRRSVILASALELYAEREAEKARTGTRLVPHTEPGALDKRKRTDVQSTFDDECRPDPRVVIKEISHDVRRTVMHLLSCSEALCSKRSDKDALSDVVATLDGALHTSNAVSRLLLDMEREQRESRSQSELATLG